MMLFLYSCVTWLLQPFVRRKIARRSLAEPVYGEHIHERFGCYDAYTGTPNCPLIWIHAVSLGETRAAAILLKELRIIIPNLRLLLTNGTATGRVEGKKLLLSGDMQVWQPWDTAAATARFLSHFKPTVGILMETEIWPNLIANAKRLNIPTVLANARMSKKSLAASQRFQWLAGQTYQKLTRIYAQTEEDAERLARLGARVDAVFGNLKFDVTANKEQMLQASAFKAGKIKPIIVFASSREGEEIEFLAALKTLNQYDFERVQWLIVPRHPQRFDEVAALIACNGFEVSKRGAWTPNSVWLGNSIGEMAFYYGISNVALLGGSFAKLGGQNLIESLAYGCPIVMGPHTFNFDEAADLAALSGVAFRMDSLASAVSCALRKIDTTTLKEQAMAFVQTHRGAATKTAVAVQQLLGQ